MGMYELGRETGDTTLVVTPIRDEDIDVFEAPPKKKRKLNVKVSGITLRSSSPVFEQMLTVNMQEQQQKRVVIHARSANDVEDMVYFMCTDKLKEDANVLSLVRLAHCYQVDGLFWKCVEKMVEKVSVDTFAETV